MADFTKLQADVAAQTDVIVSAKTAFDALAAAIADLKTHVAQDAVTQKAIDDLAAQVEANSGALAAAVPKNT